MDDVGPEAQLGSGRPVAVSGEEEIGIDGDRRGDHQGVGKFHRPVGGTDERSGPRDVVVDGVHPNGEPLEPSVDRSDAPWPAL